MNNPYVYFLFETLLVPNVVHRKSLKSFYFQKKFFARISLNEVRSHIFIM